MKENPKYFWNNNSKVKTKSSILYQNSADDNKKTSKTYIVTHVNRTTPIHPKRGCASGLIRMPVCLTPIIRDINVSVAS